MRGCLQIPTPRALRDGAAVTRFDSISREELFEKLVAAAKRGLDADAAAAVIDAHRDW